MEGYLGKSGEEYILYSKDNSVLGISSGTIEGRKLSKQNCQAIENGYDLFELAHEACNITDPLRLDSQKYKQDPYFMIGFNKGFQKALELKSDKKFSEEDMLKAIEMYYGKDKIFIEIIQSLQQTEFDVEIEMTEDWYDGFKSKPKLDADGCLILRRK